MNDRDFVLGILDHRSDELDTKCMIAEINFKNTGDPRFQREIELMRSEKYRNQITKCLVQSSRKSPVKKNKRGVKNK
jgi:hypothetical protein